MSCSNVTDAPRKKVGGKSGAEMERRDWEGSGDDRSEERQRERARARAREREAGDLVKTALGLTAFVLGVKYASREDKDSGALWVQYRCGYRSPIEKNGYRRCSAAAHAWEDLSNYEKKVEEDEAMREKIEELNQRFKLGLLGDAKNEKKEQKKKK